MGYNSLGNIFFFGAGMYICAIVQIGLYYDVGMYTSGARTTHIVFTNAQYFTVASRRHSGGGHRFRRARDRRRLDRSGLARALDPRDRHARHRHRRGGIDFFLGMGWRGQRHLDAGVSIRGGAGSPSYFLLFALAFVLLRCPFAGFIRPISAWRSTPSATTRRRPRPWACTRGADKRTAWAISALFLGVAGAIFGNMTGFIEPRDIAFPTTTFNIFMVIMVLLGGKGTLWGPVIGAVVFHTIKEVTWTYFLGWQFIALGLMIVVTIVYFQQGIAGWLAERYSADVRAARRA